MKRFLTACVLTICLLAAALPAAAFETPVTSDKGKAILNKMGTDLTPVAARLGSPAFVWADFVDKGRVAALVYTPSADNFKKSARKVSMAIYAMPGKPDEDKKIMTAAAQSLVAGYQSKGHIIKQDIFHNSKDEPGVFLHYTIGEGAKIEHNAGVFLRLTPYTAAFIQMQSVGKELSADDIAKVRALLGGPASTAKAKTEAAGKKG